MCFYDMVSEDIIQELFCAEWDFEWDLLNGTYEEEYDTDEFSSVYGDTRADKELGKSLISSSLISSEAMMTFTN
jgi:hypothetical protein